MTCAPPNAENLRLALPKGRMEANVLALLAGAGISMTASTRSYRPQLSLAGVEAKLLKPQNIVEMLHSGSRDVGFAGADWVAELGAPVEELLDTGFDPVSIVAAAPTTLLGNGGRLPERPLRIASEYIRLATAWAEARGLDATVVRSYGATEVLPPEDADIVVDNSATGATLSANGLEVLGKLMTSTTRLYASRASLADPSTRQRIEDLTLLLRSVLEARERVVVEVNSTAERLEAVVAVLPSMRQPTVASLFGGSGYAIKAAVPRAHLPELIPALKAAGASDLIVSELAQIVP